MTNDTKQAPREIFVSLPEAFELGEILEAPDDVRYVRADTVESEAVAWIQPDHLAKARAAPFMCRVHPTQRDDFVPLYLHPPRSNEQTAPNPSDGQGARDAERSRLIATELRKLRDQPGGFNHTERSVLFRLAAEELEKSVPLDKPAEQTAQDGAVGWKLAMRVLQSPMYAELDDAEKAECDALIKANPYIGSKPETAQEDREAFKKWFDPDDRLNYLDCWTAALEYARKK